MSDSGPYRAYLVRAIRPLMKAKLTKPRHTRSSQFDPKPSFFTSARLSLPISFGCNDNAIR
jgi:hypothetical protein